MNESQLMGEMRALHNRCDDLSNAVSTITQAVSEDVLRTRAYESIINRSWLLTRFFDQRKIVAEMNRIDDDEGQLRQTKEEREHRAFVNEKMEQAKAMLAAKASNRDDRREKQLNRELRKSGNGVAA